MIRALERVIVPTVLIAAGTWLAGWWSVPLVASLWQIRRREGSPWLAGVAGFLAWAALLGWLGPAEPIRKVADRLAAILGVPGFVPGLVPPLFAGLLAWSAAGVAHHSAYLWRHRGIGRNQGRPVGRSPSSPAAPVAFPPSEDPESARPGAR